jgi:tyrosinase
MSEHQGDTFVHVIANIDTETGKGSIRYVLPSRQRTSSAGRAAANAPDNEVRLVLLDAAGTVIGRVQPELRFEACHGDEKPHRAIIQQDVEVPAALSEIDLEYRGQKLDAFRPERATSQAIEETVTFGLPMPGHPDKLTLGTPGIGQRAGVTYLIQAKPNNADQWQTLAIGQPTPQFVVDKNQFPGAASLEVRITQNAGFQSKTVDQRTIELATNRGAVPEGLGGANVGAAAAVTHVRRNVWELGSDWADPILWYARAVGALRTKAINDRTSWRFWAGMHGYHQGLWEFYGYKSAAEPIPTGADFDKFWEQCQHGSWFFLPWHRGYLIGFEKLIRSTVQTLGGPADWTLPYWNYFKTNQNGLPPAFGSPDWPDGQGNNPLFIEQRWGPDPQQPGTVFIPLDAVDLNAMTVPDFTGVASGGDPGFGGVDTGFEHGGDTHGDLESQPHDQVHGLVGGEKLFPGVSTRPLPGLMSAPQTAGLDPIFWLHHANIDRLWEAWRRLDPANNSDPQQARWKDGPASLGQRSFVVPLANGTPWEFTPGQMSDFASLDYTYSDFTPGDPLVAGMPGPARPGAAMAGGAAMPPPRGPATVEVVGASSGPLPVSGAGAQTSVQLDATMRGKVAANLASGPAPGSRAETVLLNLENVRGYSDATVLKVYLEAPGQGGAPPIERPVGSIGLFGVTKATDPNVGRGEGLSYVLNITKAYSELAGSGNADKIGVRLKAVAPVHDAADVKIGRISIVRQGG